MADLALYLLGSLLVGGYYLNKSGKQSRKVLGKREKVPETEIPVGDNIYHNTRWKTVRDHVQRVSDESYEKARDPFNQNVIPPFFNVLGKEELSGHELIRTRGGQGIGNRFINETGQITEIDSSPMFNPLTPLVTEARDLSRTVPRGIGLADPELPGNYGNSISGSPSSNIQGLGLNTFGEPQDKIEQFKVSNRRSADPKGLPSKQEHFANFTIHGPRNSNNPNYHNNMVPFFGGKGTQNINPEAQQLRLEIFTGQTNNPTEFRSQPKREIPSLYDGGPNQTYVYGTPNENVSRERDRYVTSFLKTKVSPTEQIRVGPGAGYGYDAVPRDGFHPMYRPTFRNVDDLRVNPKNTYEGRVLAGKEMVTNRGIEGRFFKRRPDRFYVNNPDRYFRTTGAYTAPQVREQFFAYKTNREQTTQDYTGIASGVGDTLAPKPGVYLQGSQPDNVKGGCTGYQPGYRNVGIQGQVQHTRRNQFPHAAPRNTFAPGENHPNFDYAVGGYVAYGQERESTERPLGSQRLNPFRNDGTQIYPYDTARTTTRQTTNVKDYQGIAGTKDTERGIKYPYDTARTTTRQTTNVKDYQGIAGTKDTERSTKYPYDTARTTTRQTTNVKDYQGIAGTKDTERGTKYPYDTARTTTRQTTNVKDYQGIAGTKGTEHAIKYPYDTARTTTRQTVNVKDYQGISGAVDGTRNPRSYEAEYNATNKGRQETILEGRIYGPNKSTNVTIGSCDINAQITSRTGYDITKYGQLPNKQYQQPTSIPHNFGNTTSQGNRDTTGIRQPAYYLVQQFNSNPYTQSLHSATPLTPQN